MAQDKNKQPDSKILKEEAQARREFLKKAGAIGATAPAVALLLSAKPTTAGVTPSVATDIGVSDIRLKRDIALLSRLNNGLGLYRYRYLWSDQAYVGVMAQEVEKVMPGAVVRGADGYLRVDYQQLGRRLMTWHEWSESSKAVPAVAA